MSLARWSLVQCHRRLMTRLWRTPRRDAGNVGFITRGMGDSFAKRAAVSLAVLQLLGYADASLSPCSTDTFSHILLSRSGKVSRACCDEARNNRYYFDSFRRAISVDFDRAKSVVSVYRLTDSRSSLFTNFCHGFKTLLDTYRIRSIQLVQSRPTPIVRTTNVFRQRAFLRKYIEIIETLRIALHSTFNVIYSFVFRNELVSTRY